MVRFATCFNGNVVGTLSELDLFPFCFDARVFGISMFFVCFVRLSICAIFVLCPTFGSFLRFL